LRQNSAAANGIRRGARARRDPDMNKTNAPRPQIRNVGIGDLINYRLPPAGIVSILHRASGVLLFLALPLLLRLLDLSLSSETSFDRYLDFFHGVFARLLLLVLGWALLHHLSAGVRYLLLDLHVGLDKHAAQRSSWVVFGVSLALTLLFAIYLFGGRS
jgi:succinate dehydrogenase / fumarate reductase, cytochrome b subunit